MHVPGFENLEEFLQNGEHRVFRARRADTRQPVLLKTVSRVPSRAPDREPLEREYGLLGSLHVDGVVRAHDLLRVGDTSWLVMDDPGLEPLAAFAGVGRSDLGLVLRLGIRLGTIIDALHRRDVVHGGISPWTVVADASGAMQVIDLARAFRVRPAGSGTVPVIRTGASVTAYTSPEQTGRMNRGVDHRTDFYSFGATLYELLTGRRPHETDDPLELVHAQIARTPPAPAELAATVPDMVSRLVMRLLSKAAEDRYQSSRGLLCDLERCEREWRASHAIRPFQLAHDDVSDRFLIPRRLYGRERERSTLTAAFDEAAAGGAAVVLVSGPSGAGKTAVIEELYRPLVRQRGFLISGKFDQVVRSVPYAGLAQAFRSLVWQLLAEPEDRLAEWRQRIAAAAGVNGGVLTAVVPELELIIGRPPPATVLDPADTQNRLRYVFQSIVCALADASRPLVLFLDDLQWADAATLDLLPALWTAPDLHHLLCVAAYRSTEVQKTHPLAQTLAGLSAGESVRHVQLGPLTVPDLEQLLSDTLRSGATDVAPLARLLVEKTEGNPFFAIQFLTTLHEDGAIAFDHARSQWSFDAQAAARAGITDNVVALLTERIERLPSGARDLLRLAACIGNPFEWETLLTVSRRSPDAAVADLSAALDAGLIRATEAPVFDNRPDMTAAPSYTFLHDRVQQAAYGLIPDDERAVVHGEVGRSLLVRYGTEVPDERLFEIVNHLNVPRETIADPGERVALIRLNLAAGRKAKISAAYVEAVRYLELGIALVGSSDWGLHGDLVFALHLEASECLYLAGRFDEAERMLASLLPRARTTREAALVHAARVVLSENLSRYADAVASGREALSLFGVTFPDQPSDIDAALEQEVALIDRLRGGRPISSLGALPEMADPDVRTILRILTSLWAPAYLSAGRRFTSLLSARMVLLSLEHGVTEDSAYGFVTHAITVGPVRGAYEEAFEWGELALAVNDRFGDTRRRAKIHQQFHAHVKLWRRSFESCVPHAREARRSGLETGDFTYAAYGAVTETWPAFLTSRNLEAFVREYAPVASLLETLRMSDFREALQVMIRWALALQGRTNGPLSLSDAQFDERAFLHRFASAPFFLTFLHVARLHVAVLLCETDAALVAARRARTAVVDGTIWPVLVQFWGGLAEAAAWDRLSDGERDAAAFDLSAAVTTLDRLAESCPENFRCWALVLTAERHRLEGRIERSMRALEEALAYARATANLQQEALASELGARLLSSHDASRAAALLRRAHRCYGQWGAFSKTAQLERAHASLFQESTPRADPRQVALQVTTADVSLDLATVMKVASAIAGEIELDGLLTRLMQLAIENAGAERGVFARARGGQLVIEAEAAPGREAVRLREPVPCDDAPLAASVARYVHRTGQAVVSGDASSDERFASDTYLRASGPRSILCVPVGLQGRTGGVLYLENTLATEAFTAERVELMRVLAAQAAISLENAELYGEMKREVSRRTAAEAQLRDALDEVERLKDRLQAENVYLQEEISLQHNFNEIVGNSPALLEALYKVERVAPTDSTVLITGETGSGKELFARAVHSRSRRGDRPLVKVNCGAIPPGLVESELFGHVKGAFTGAVDKRVGRFELAHGGTIFLDEIGELPAEAQVKLLRVLQEHEFEPVGSSRTVRVDVRVIAATNRDLPRAVREGTFRSDLLYRLNVFPILVPPLRDRVADIPLLAGFFITRLERRLDRRAMGFSARSVARMQRYAWPGNVRELQNVVERAAILATGPVLDIESGMLDPGSGGDGRNTGGTLDDVQRVRIQSALETSGGVIDGPRGAASMLGIHPNTLRSRMKKLGIVPRPSFHS